MPEHELPNETEPRPHAELRFRVEPAASNLSMGRHIIATMAQRCSPHHRDIVLLVASELLANAVQHASTSIEARIEFHGRYTRIDVVDDGDGWPRLRHVDPLSEAGGRGLSIVDRLSMSWGVEDLIPGKQVWSIIATAAANRQDHGANAFAAVAS
jgi:anti-sigma regulatory factor (Ser/Thr protein kinase)